MKSSLKVIQEACRASRIVYKEVPADGKWHVTDATNKPPQNGNGRIRLFSDGAGGMVHNWATMDKPELFFFDSDIKLSAADTEERKLRVERERAAADKELTEIRAKAATLANELWKRSSAVVNHPYLERKQVQPTDTIKMLDVTDISKIIGYHPKSKGQELTGIILMAPIVTAGGFTSVEMIDESGLKAALAGGQKAGGYWKTSSSSAEVDLFVVGEGVATVLSASMAVGCIGVAALSCHNLKPAAERLRKNHPNAKIVVVSDVGNGEDAAIEAARSINGYLAKPSFPTGSTGTDINDLHVESGLQAVKDCLQSAKFAQQLSDEPVIEPTSTSAKQAPVAGASGGVTLVQGSTINPENIIWVWFGWLPSGKLVILAGQPGTGKTTVTLSIAAIITIGGRLPDGTTSSVGSVVIWSGEDGVADTITPRLIAMGADMTKVYFVEGRGGQPFEPSRDMAQLAKRVKAVPDVKLIIVDPVVSAISGDSHKNAEVRKSLQPLVDMGKETGACIVGISHFNKSGGKTANPLDLISGSIAFAAVARVVIGAAKLQNPDEHGHTRIFCRIKSNIGPDEDGVGYDLRMESLSSRPDIEASVVLWGQYVKGHSRDLLSKANASQPSEKSKLMQAEDFLRDLLSGGGVASTTVEDEAKSAGISISTLRKAKESLGVINIKEPGAGGKWLYVFPPEELRQERCQNPTTQNDSQVRQDGQDSQLTLSHSPKVSCPSSITTFYEHVSQHGQLNLQSNLPNLPKLTIKKDEENMSKLLSEESLSGGEEIPDFDWEDK